MPLAIGARMACRLSKELVHSKSAIPRSREHGGDYLKHGTIFLPARFEHTKLVENCHGTRIAFMADRDSAAGHSRALVAGCFSLAEHVFVPLRGAVRT
jgi:hypothetical protein